MNKDIQSIQKDIANDFALSDLLYELIKSSVDCTVQDVLSKCTKEQKKYPDAIRCGAYEAWIQRLTGMLVQKDRDYLLQLLQNTFDKPSSRE